MATKRKQRSSICVLPRTATTAPSRRSEYPRKAYAHLMGRTGRRLGTAPLVLRGRKSELREPEIHSAPPLKSGTWPSQTLTNRCRVKVRERGSPQSRRNARLRENYWEELDLWRYELSRQPPIPLHSRPVRHSPPTAGGNSRLQVCSHLLSFAERSAHLPSEAYRQRCANSETPKLPRPVQVVSGPHRRARVRVYARLFAKSSNQVPDGACNRQPRTRHRVRIHE